MKKDKKSIAPLFRVLKMLRSFYPVLFPVTCVCIIFSAVTATVPAVFQQKVIADIVTALNNNMSWSEASAMIIPKVTVLASLYVVSLCCIIIHTQLMAVMTQGFLNKMRSAMFNDMQNLPIRYFDTHKHGDIMSYYTNDIDTLRQFVSDVIPTIIQSSIIVVCVLGIMFYYSLWMTLVVIAGVSIMLFSSGKIGKGSAKYFVKNQAAIAKAEAYVQEMMNGQKVIKVFNHEDECKAGFDKVNDEVYDVGFKAHAYANCLAPIINNIGNVLYVIIATVGGILLLTKVPNIGIMALFKGVGVLTIDVVVPFLNMTKQFTGNVNRTSQQMNLIVMASAGAKRIFSLIDEKPEVDEGYVTLVNCEYDENNNIVEVKNNTGHWAWRHPHRDGTLTYTPLAGDVRMFDVDFGYVEGKTVLHGINLYAEPGQKVAFVGATGAGKTTITNLLNRFYDIEDGKIRYDGININKIKKADLRRSLGVVLQDTNLFTGTVMENIRYGNLDASDDECIGAAMLAGADDFITRLPDGYNTMITNNGDNLSQGQRQLISIARAAVANPPVMILDEATSSIDTRTEQIVQEGMDNLMYGRTVFVIAHRLSTVKNADVIMVLDHGHIIEKGDHQKLLMEKGVYWQLYTGAFELE